MLVELVLLSNSSDAAILRCDLIYGHPLFAQSWPAIWCRHRISQVIENSLEKLLSILQK
jgi:hypothetical protein